MAFQSNRLPNDLEAKFTLERPRLVGLCRKLTGNIQAAEDLAQETLIAAWRNIHQLRQPERFQQWLFGIARNICRSWIRARRREQTQFMPEDSLSADFDIEIELERNELADLLDKALPLLPPDTRNALILRYVEESPHAEIAAQLGLSKDAVAMRLNRGKLALRRVLVTDLKEEVTAYGLCLSGETHWQGTRIWCPLCGKSTLQGHLDRSIPQLRLRCTTCNRIGTDLIRTGGDFLLNYKALKPALNRLLAGLHTTYHEQAIDGTIPCSRCGRKLLLRFGYAPDWLKYGIHAWCDQCEYAPGVESWWSLTLCLPEVRRFWKECPQIRLLPEREVETAGAYILVTGFENMWTNERIEVIHSRQNYAVLGVYRTSV